MDSCDYELIARRDRAALACIDRTQIQPAAIMTLRNPGNLSIWLTLRAPPTIILLRIIIWIVQMWISMVVTNNRGFLLVQDTHNFYERDLAEK